MKFRMTKNSIRVRILKSELSRLLDAHSILETVQFPDGSQLSLLLQTKNSMADQLEAHIEGSRIQVSMNKAVAEQWGTSDLVGVERVIPLKVGSLHLLVEKDFPCHGRVDEDKSETFEELEAKVTEGGIE